MMSWLTDRDPLVVLLITGQRRRGGGATPADCGCFAIAKSNVAGFEYQYGGGASQVLLGRLHRRDGMRRLMLRFRELLDVVLQPVEHGRQLRSDREDVDRAGTMSCARRINAQTSRWFGP